MLQKEIKDLFFEDITALDTTKISTEVLKDFDEYLMKISEQNNVITEEAFSIYKKFVSMKQEAPENMKNHLFSVILSYIKEKISNNQYADALFMYRFLIVKSTLEAEEFYNIAECLYSLGDNNLYNEFIHIYENTETNKPLMFLTLANFYNLQLKDYKKAIKYYENYVKIDKTKSVVYSILAGLYAKTYGELSLKDQIYYFEKVYNLKPNNKLALHGLAFSYDKLGDKTNANKFYKLLLENNPTDTDLYNYGAFLISCGEFQQGHKYFTKRFDLDDINFEYPLKNEIGKKWDFITDISDKTLLVSYEQGFGDTFMYCRFIPFLKSIAKKVIFIVQDELYDLIKNSKLISDGIELYSNSSIDLKKLDYDYNMALLDAPYVLNIDTSSIPFVNGYLNVDNKKIKEYAKKYIKKSKHLKVGIAYQGNKATNYGKRDIEFARFKNLLNTPDIDFYSLQVNGDEENEIISLGKTFKNFTDTACAIKNMDIIISTDNVILNLAGALGAKTLALFNKSPNYRWFKLSGNDTGWYKSARPLQVEENNCWSDVFAQINNILSEYK